MSFRWGNLLAACASWLVVGMVSAQVEWISTLNKPASQSAHVVQGDCLMPRLGASSPILSPRPPASAPGQPAATHWWARTQDYEWTSGGARWSRFDPASGAVNGGPPTPLGSCGTPITPDGGGVVATMNSGNRLSKFDANGAPVWVASSNQNPVDWSGNTLVSVGANGDVTFAVGSLLGRTNAAGAFLFQTETYHGYPRYLAVDGVGDTWIVSGNTTSGPVHVTRVSTAGTLLWSTVVDSPCADAVTSALLTSNSEMFVAMQSCYEGRVAKISAAGQIQWQRLVSGPPGLQYVRPESVAVDGDGNVYVAACASSNYSSGPNVRTVVASWNGAGAERWTTSTDLLNSSGSCVASLTPDANGNLFVTSSSTDGTGSPALWALTTSGVELWRHRAVLANPVAANSALAIDAAGKLLVLGNARIGNGDSTATVRRINVSMLGSSLRLKVLEVPATAVGYRDAFAVRVGIRTAADVAANAAADTVVSLALANGSGRLGGSLNCMIVTGASECTATGVRYDVVEAGVVLIASADGFAAAPSSPIAFRKADTVTTLEALTTAPYNGFSIVRIRAVVQGPPPGQGHGSGGYLNGPYSVAYPGVENCSSTYVPDSLPSVECDLLVRVAAMPVTTQFNTYSGDNRYNSSNTASLSLPITKALPVLQVSSDPTNTYITNDRVRFRVAVMAPNGFNATPLLPANSVHVTGGSCTTLVNPGSFSNKYAGAYLLCEIEQVTTTQLNVTIEFPGSEDLLPAASVQQMITTHDGAVLRGDASSPSPISVCTTAPGAVCSVTDNEWQCAGPSPMTGQIFLVPTPSTGSYYARGLPISFYNHSGAYRYTNHPLWQYQFGACKADVDGDGVVMAMTDGVLILRRMLGLSGSALTQGATHSCVPLSPAGIAAAISVAAYDLDGDGLVQAEKDGLLLLRSMLGFRGEALVNGLISASSQRRTGSEIISYLQASCNFSLF